METSTSGAISEAGSGTDVDALVVVGAESGNGLNGISDLVMDDVYENIKVLSKSNSPINLSIYQIIIIITVLPTSPTTTNEHTFIS